MEADGFQIQILMADEMVNDFLADPDIQVAGIYVESTKSADESATLNFELLGAITVITAIASALNNIVQLAGPLARLLKKSPKPLVVATAFGTITLEPSRTLTQEEIRKLLVTLATL